MPVRRLERIALEKVQLSESRPCIPETINALAESMAEIGLTNPITVRIAKTYQKGIFDDGYAVVAGNHRVGGARALGWTHIDAFIVEGLSDLELELIEIDENLRRAELTPAQKADWMSRRKFVWEALHANSGQTLPENVRGRPREFAGDTETATGEAKRTVNLHLSRADVLGDDIKRVVNTSLDKGVELDALKKLDEPTRKEVIDRAASGEDVSARDYLPGSDSSDPKKLDRLLSQLIGEIDRVSRNASPDEVAEAMAARPLNPDHAPYVQAVFNAYRALRRAA